MFRYKEEGQAIFFKWSFSHTVKTFLWKCFLVNGSDLQKGLKNKKTFPCFKVFIKT